MVFTVRNAARILNTTYNRIVWVRGGFNVLNVLMRGCSPRFVSARSFWAAFVNLRKQGAQSVNVRHLSGYYWQAQGQNEIYDLELQPASVTCSCMDYKERVAEVQHTCCKHGYAVLNQLGFTSLAAYLAR